MVTKSKSFEQIISILLNAEFDKKIIEQFKDQQIKRQFDGYRDIVSDPELISTNYAIECKNWTYPVKIDHIESFAYKLIRCGINKGIYVTTSEYQRGAIEEAKVANITLLRIYKYQIDPSSDKIEQINLKLKITVPKIKNVTMGLEKPFYLNINDSVQMNYQAIKDSNDYIFNSGGYLVGRITTKLEEQLKSLKFNPDQNEYRSKLDLNNFDYFMIVSINNQLYPSRLKEINFEVHLMLVEDEIEITEKNSYVIENVITGEQVRVPEEQIKEIITKYQLSNPFIE